jgi:hypothetical protein
VRDVATDALDLLALLLIAAGVGGYSARWLGWGGLAVAGVVILAGSLLIVALGRKAGRGGGG